MARKFSTPGIKRIETDIGEVVAPAGTSTGAIIGGATKGPINARIKVSTDKELVEKFGKPQPDWVDYAGNGTSTVDAGIYAGLEFLQESNSLYYFRVADGTEQYANLSASTSETGSMTITAASAAGVTGLAYTPTEIPDIDNPGTAIFKVASIGPGIYGNNVGVRLVTSASWESSNEATASATSAFVAATSGDVDWSYNYDAPEGDGRPLGTTSGTPTWQKVFKLQIFTRATTADSFDATDPIEEFYGTIGDVLGPNGANLNIKNVVNGVSKYVYVDQNGMTAGIPPFYTSAGTGGNAVALANGADKTTTAAPVAVANIDAGWDFFADREKVSVNILLGTFYGATSTAANKTAMKQPIETAYSRQDCIATMQVGAPNQTGAAAIVTEGNGYSHSNPSYGARYAGWSLVYDSYNDKNVYLPNSLYGGMLMARTDRIAETWIAPAGIRRGRLSVLGQNVKFNSTEIGNLYDANINSVKFINGQGNVMWGQRTAQRQVTALREIAVRRMLLFIEESMEQALYPFIFEPNTDSTRLRIFSILDSFMAGVKAGDGVDDYKVVVDDTNNSADDVDNNILNVDVYVTPVRTIEFIQLQVVITRSGVNLAEITV